MESLKLILIAVAVLSLAMLGLATQILLKKGGKFPNTHVSGNKHLKKKGIVCAQAFDKMEQEKVRKQVDLTTLKVLEKE